MAQELELKPLDIDGMSNLRYLHASAFRALAYHCHTPEEISAFVTLVYSPPYAARLLTRSVTVARLAGELVGSAAWTPMNDMGKTARVSDVFVLPMFARQGIGTLLARHVEDEARRAGFTECAIRAPMNAEPFFRALGYQVSSHGVRTLPDDVDMQVVFMRRSLAVDRVTAA
ncbi:MAG: GNAT family N-acetyltransferase [Hyphomicrobiaceae bacterium]